MQVCVDRLDPVAIGSATIVAAEGGGGTGSPYSILEVHVTLRQDLDRTGDVAAISLYAQHSNAAGDASWEDVTSLAYLPSAAAPPQVRMPLDCCAASCQACWGFFKPK